MIGDKHDTEALGCQSLGTGAVEEHSRHVEARWRLTVESSRREDADMSNDKTGEIPVRRKPKVSRATFFVPGLVGT